MCRNPALNSDSPQKVMGSIRGRAGYGELLLNPDLRRWYENVRRGSPITADVYLRRLGATCLKKGLTPTALAEQPRDKGDRWAFNFLADLVTEMESEKKAGSYIASNVKAVKSWLSHNGIQVAGKIRIKGARETPSLATKHAPSLAELRGLFANCSPRTRSAAALVGEAGLRLESIGNYYGTDGLTVGDLPEMKISHNDEGSQSEGALVMFSRIPTIVIVRQELSKAGHQYFTFLTREGCGFLAEYLTQRIKSGERLDPSSPLLAPDEYHNSRRNLFLRTTLVSRLIRYRLRSCRIAARPYDLRSSFDTHLMLAESNGVIIRDYRVFFMGHKGDIEHTYTTNKRVLQPNVVEDMRSSFAKAQRHLQSAESIPEGPSLRDETYKRMLVLAGFTEKEIVEQRLLEVDDDQVAQKAREKLFSSVFGEDKGQKIVPLERLEEYLSKGWRCEHVLESRGQAIISPPTPS